MERVLRSKNSCINFSSDFCLLEKVLNWLEREDTELEKFAGYGFCVAAIAYFTARMMQFIF